MILLHRLFAHNFKQLKELELAFPARGRILVEGRNEAGKSTLFEAVFFALFGKPLIGELADLVAYGQEKARVELDLTIRQQTLKITRTIKSATRRDKKSGEEKTTGTGDADLVVVNATGEESEIGGVTAVNHYIVSALGFDGDALLNTCFVEQKKLEKLEGLTRAQREESLSKLLNLDALLKLEQEFDETRKLKDKEFPRLQARVRLAELQSQLPAREQELAQVEGRIKLVELRRLVVGALEETRALASLDAEIADLTARRDTLAARVVHLDQIREAMRALKTAIDNLDLVEQQKAEIARLTSEQADLERRAREDLPNLERRGAELHRLAARLERLEHIDATRAEANTRAITLAERLGNYHNAQERLKGIAEAITTNQMRVTELEGKLRDYEVGEALGEWIAAREAVASAEEPTTELAQKQADRAHLSAQFRSQAIGLAVALTLALVLAIALPVALVLLARTLFALIAAIILLLVAFGLGFLLARRFIQHSRDLARLAEEIGKLEGATATRSVLAETARTRLEATQTRLQSLGIALPANIDFAQSARVQIARTLENKTRDELRAELDATREQYAANRAKHEEITRAVSMIDFASAEAEIARCRSVAQKAERLLNVWRPRAVRWSQQLSVAPQTRTVQNAVFQIQAEARQLRQRLAEAASTATRIAERQTHIAALFEQVRAGYESARGLVADAREWSPKMTRDEFTALGKNLRRQFDELGGEGVRGELDAIAGELGKRVGQRGIRARNFELMITRGREILRELRLGAVLPEAVAAEDLEDLRGRLEQLGLEDEPTLRAKQRELVGTVRSLRDQHARLESELGVAGESLDESACREEMENAAREIALNENAAKIVQTARRRVMQSILPATMDYMRRLLPALTRDRYHDAQLDPDTFKIQVWDERAGQNGALKEKNIFSGGTKDQFSLALRLAFALATLPQERGTAPGFIFLDEPLGSFDDERADALLYLLTEGEIARAFDQIFLISHVRVRADRFTHRITLENGRVVNVREDMM